MERMPLLANRVVLVLHTSIADVDEPTLSRMLARLPLPEQERACRFRRNEDRARFVVGRLLLREIAARGLGVEADSVALDTEPAGRPVVRDAPNPVFVSLAHSGKHVTAALARRPVGIDVEELPRQPVESGVVERVCSPRERRALDRLTGEARHRGFIRIWTRKEAYGKALGVGIGFGLQSVTVGTRGSWVRGVRGVWRIIDLDLGSDCAAALVSGMAAPRVQLSVVESKSL